MVINMSEYVNMLENLNINIVYSGPMWENGVKGLADLVRAHLSGDAISKRAEKAIFAVFIEQVTNVLMYSENKARFPGEGNETVEKPTGMLILGSKEGTYFIQTRNQIKADSVDYITNKIDHLNTLDKKELRAFHKEKMRSENENPDSKGGGLGLIEIARRATAPIGYKFETTDAQTVYFTMYAEISQEVS